MMSYHSELSLLIPDERSICVSDAVHSSSRAFLSF